MRRLAILSLAALAFAGCAVGPDYRRPEVESPAVLARADKDVDNVADTAWWGQFDDPVLDNLIRDRPPGEPGPPDRHRPDRRVRGQVRLHPRGPLSPGRRGRLGGARAEHGGDRQHAPLGI